MLELQNQKLEKEFVTSIIYGNADLYAKLSRIRKILTDDCFTDVLCRKAWTVICAMHDAQREITVVSFHSQAMKIYPQDALALITMENSQVNFDLVPLALSIASLKMRRDIHQALADGIAQLESEPDPYVVGVLVIEKLKEMSHRIGGVDDFSRLSASVLQHMSDVLNGTADTPVLSGFSYIDHNGGLKAGNFDVVAGRTSNGKTAFATAIAVNVAKQGVPVMVFGFEMTNMQVASRIMSMESGVPVKKVEFPDEEAQLLQVNSHLPAKALPLYFDRSRKTDVDMLLANIRSSVADLGVRVVVIDYLQQLTGKLGNRREVLSDACVRLKNLAVELDITIIALSQLARSDDPVPQMWQLKEAGEIENSADNVHLVYRAELYHGQHFPEPFAQCDTYHKAMIINCKARSGSTGSFLVDFNPECVHYQDIVEIPEKPTSAESFGHQKGFLAN